MRTLVSTLCLALPLAAQSACEDLSQLDGLMQYSLVNLQVPGLSLQVTKAGATRFEKTYGSYTLDTVVSIASGSKWLSSALLLVLVDEGKVQLDDKVSLYLPGFTGAKNSITLRQCLAHTSGLPLDDAALANPASTLGECASVIASKPLAYNPGSTFAYGECGMQIAGRVAEVVGGKSWATLFAQKLATPLGMTRTDYAGLGVTTNPRIGAGARSTLREYGTFLRMLLNGGMHGPTRVLKAASVQEMFKDQIGTAVLLSQPFPTPRRYGLGCWRDRWSTNGTAHQVSSPGIFGFSPWIDLERGMTGVFLVQDSMLHVFPTVDGLQAVIRDLITPIGVTCYGLWTTACAGPIVLNALAVPRRASPDFGLLCHGVPPNTPGVIVLAAQQDVTGLLVEGIKLHLSLAGPILPLGVLSDPIGESWVTLAIPGSAVLGSKLYTQFLWNKPVSCQRQGLLAASNALAITIQ